MAKMGTSNARTLALAEASFERIKALVQPADPKSYELWYAYLAGEPAFAGEPASAGHPAAAGPGTLKQAVDEVLAHGSMSARDVEALHTAHIGGGLAADKVNQLGSQVADEIGHVLTMIDTAQGAATTYGERLNAAGRRLDQIQVDKMHDRETLSDVVDSLTCAGRTMQANNSSLRAQLRCVLQEVAELRGALEAARQDCLTDALTSLGNRKHLDRMLAAAVARCGAEKQPLSLLLIDIDQFKQVNDTHGHVVGDRVLRFVALTLERNLEDQGAAARYGGDEFAVVLPNTSLSVAARTAERIRRNIVSKDLLKHLVREKRTPLTVSIGVAALDRAGSVQALVAAADACLYAAKRSGRNRVIVASDDQLKSTAPVSLAAVADTAQVA